jgi:hypothetical protein
MHTGILSVLFESATLENSSPTVEKSETYPNSSRHVTFAQAAIFPAPATGV